MKKYFNFYRVYYDISKRLNRKRSVLFIRTLSKTLLKDGYGLEHAKKVFFDDKILDKEWLLVIKQLSKRDRDTQEYREWRSAVFERDNYTCVDCEAVGVKLNAHHVVRWVDSIELRYDISNGATLCEPCHKEVHSATNT